MRIYFTALLAVISAGACRHDTHDDRAPHSTAADTMRTNNSISETTLDGLAQLRVELVSSGPETLVLKLRLKNLHRGELALFNRLPKPGDAEHRPTKDTVYTYLRGTTLYLSQWIPPIPKGANISLPVVPAFILLDAGGIFEGELRIALPVRTGDAYQAIRDRLEHGNAELGDARRQAQNCVVQLGIMPVSNRKTLYPLGDPSEGIFATSSPAVAIDLHRVITSDSLSLAAPVVVQSP